MLCSYRSVTCPPLLFVGRGACWMRLSFNIGVHGYRGRKIAALKADIRMLTERKDWYDSQISSGRLNAEEIQVKQDILQHVLAALAQLSKELHALEQLSGA